MEQEYFKAGFISRSHGIKGELKAKFEVTDISKYSNKASVFLAKNGETPALFHVETFRVIAKDEAILQLKEIKGRNEADLMRSYDIFYPLEDLPKLAKDDFYYHDILGFSVIDAVLGPIGKIEEVIEMPGQDLIRILVNEKEILIPIVPHFILKLDKKNKEIQMNLPSGLVDIYLVPGNEDPETDTEN